jgi:hypothetical protein
MGAGMDVHLTITALRPLIKSALVDTPLNEPVICVLPCESVIFRHITVDECLATTPSYLILAVRPRFGVRCDS